MAQLDYGTSGQHGLSYSRRQTLHSCPRKFEIENILGLKTNADSVTFSFGHAVAAGIQGYLAHRNRELAVFQTTLAYTQQWADLGTPSEVRAKKNVWWAVAAVDLFIQGMASQLPNSLSQLADYRVPNLADNKPAVELQFRILVNNTPDGYVYEGHIDLILVHKVTGRYAVLELKTTSLREPHDAMYANSDQALSYSIVLDKAVGVAQAAYDVIYLIYSSSAKEFYVKRFPKTAKQRIDWINNLIRDTEVIDYYASSSLEANIPYPTNGSNCYNFFKPCEYFGICGMENSSLLAMLGTREATTSFEYQDRVTFVFTLDEIIASQIARLEQGGYQVASSLSDTQGTVIDI